MRAKGAGKNWNWNVESEHVIIYWEPKIFLNWSVASEIFFRKFCSFPPYIHISASNLNTQLLVFCCDAALESVSNYLPMMHCILRKPIGIFESPKCDVNPQPNTRGIGPLVGRTSGNRRSVMHVLVEIFSITYNFSFICQYIFIWLISSGREIFPLLKYPGKFLKFEWTTKIWAQVRDWPL